MRVRVCCKATTQSHFNVGYRDCIQTTNCCSSMGWLRGIFKIEFITEKWHSLLYTGLRHYQFGWNARLKMLLWCLVCWVLRPLEQGVRYNIDRKSPTSTHIMHAYMYVQTETWSICPGEMVSFACRSLLISTWLCFITCAYDCIHHICECSQKSEHRKKGRHRPKKKVRYKQEKLL